MSFTAEIKTNTTAQNGLLKQNYQLLVCQIEALQLGLQVKCQQTLGGFNGGYAFTQPCGDDAILSQNALTYLNYFKENYNGYFGTVSIHATSSTSTYYYLTQKNDIADYFDDNPSKLYKFYYVTNPEKTEKGYFVENSVYTFEIRYEFSTKDNQYLFKLFIEKADTHHNGQTQYFYKMK